MSEDPGGSARPPEPDAWWSRPGPPSAPAPAPPTAPPGSPPWAPPHQPWSSPTQGWQLPTDTAGGGGNGYRSGGASGMGAHRLPLPLVFGLVIVTGLLAGGIGAAVGLQAADDPVTSHAPVTISTNEPQGSVQ